MKPLLMMTAALMVPAAAFAGDAIDADATFNLNVTAASYSGCDDPAFDFFDSATCSSLASSALDGFGFVWVTVNRAGGFGTGIGGAQFGVNHAGLDLSGWTLCTGGSEIPDNDWPSTSSGNAVTWGGGCYAAAGETAQIGYFSVSDADAGTMSVTGDPRIGDAQWANCDATLFSLCDENLAMADLANGTTPVCGDNCDVVPTVATSWSAIKTLY